MTTTQTETCGFCGKTIEGKGRGLRACGWPKEIAGQFFCGERCHEQAVAAIKFGELNNDRE